MSIFGDKCDACNDCEYEQEGGYCEQGKICSKFREWFCNAWKEIRCAAEKLKEDEKTMNSMCQNDTKEGDLNE